MNQDAQTTTHQDDATTQPNNHSSTWERDIIGKLAFASLREQRRARRWGIFFKLAVLAYFLLLLALYLPKDLRSPHAGEKHTALVELQGMIFDNGNASADTVISGLQAAFKNKNTKGIVLRINSPGGSPVQASYIHNEIARLRNKYPKIPLYAVITDICTSGGYYVAAAADQIYANQSSLVGSIGVLVNGFGFVNAMEKLGIERRLQTAGEHKGFLDPFSPQNPQQTAHLQSVLEEIHQQFIDAVKKGRGDRLQGQDDQLFNGLVWSGKEALRLGLVDALGSGGHVARDVIGAEKIVDFTSKRDLLARVTQRLGVSIGNALSSELGLTAPGLR
uniref:Protease-4 n=1 Tax=Candidatus Kentrum sp. MB TaxID=2138164 RepID=A0A451BDZ0_9GAMM|nr:MAG: protease-4 [Candidatus Kentron sp. MB]VFK35809.1 MAG: protease-4 [Candidatus Kentron sp. MB]VFK76445.1 MAG: protease-4 [Candidatus Kentron sp. MB]